MKYYGCIYKIVCKVNGKIYIGQTTGNIANRWYSHTYDALKRTNRSKTKLANAIVKYGKDNFEINAVCYANNEQELNIRETACIRIFNSINCGYNIAYGGGNKKHSVQTKIKISLAHKGKSKPKGFSQKLRAANLGKKRPEWVKKIMSKAQKISLYQKNKIHREETKLKISKANRGKIRTKEHCSNISKSLVGRKLNKETRHKMSISRQRRPPPNQKKCFCITNGIIYDSLKSASESLGISLNSLQHHLNGKLKTAQGYCFKYIVD
jgi:group I intron endonuclease